MKVTEEQARKVFEVLPQTNVIAGDRVYGYIHFGEKEIDPEYPWEYYYRRSEVMRWRPAEKERYYYPDIACPSFCGQSLNYGSQFDKFRIKHNLVFKTKEEAITRSKESLGIKEVDND